MHVTDYGRRDSLEDALSAESCEVMFARSEEFLGLLASELLVARL